MDPIDIGPIITLGRMAVRAIKSEDDKDLDLLAHAVDALPTASRSTALRAATAAYKRAIANQDEKTSAAWSLVVAALVDDEEGAAKP